MNPNFFIVGAPKCGTSSLGFWLSEHPQIFMSVPKEPHFFSTDLANQKIKTWKEYGSLFSEAGSNHKAIGEASTWYLYSREAVPRIEKAFPGAKYIVMTRNPVDMLQSLYQHNVRNLHEDAGTLEEAWDLQRVRSRGERIPLSCREPAFLQYKKACAVGRLVERLLQYVPQERVLHISLDALREDARKEYLKVLSFLEVQNDNRENFKPQNQARMYKSRLLQKALITGGHLRSVLGLKKGLGLKKINEKKINKENLSPEIKSMLHREFHDDSKYLRQLNRNC